MAKFDNTFLGPVGKVVKLISTSITLRQNTLEEEFPLTGENITIQGNFTVTVDGTTYQCQDGVVTITKK